MAHSDIHWVYPVRLVQALFALIEIGLTGYVVGSLQDSWTYSGAVDFMLFLGCWTAFLAVPYLACAPLWFPRLAHRFVIPAVEVVTMIFWFAAFIAIGALLPPAPGCYWSACHALQAATVFGAFEWALFVATTVFAIRELMQSRSGNSVKPANPHAGV
ncbi:uncharacterized protein PFLUO_LOCUS6516 [Penicillium psychrofluorescens]|uniref:uncharacterized protein n=1 Tax=Penicillium psychrofluorescens TaxID=3158075 RepID=UPI003CCDFF19